MKCSQYVTYAMHCRYGLPEQNFPICTDQTQPGPDGCQHVDFHHIVLNPMLLYVLWQFLYFVVVSQFQVSMRATVHMCGKHSHQRNKNKVWEFVV